MANRVERDFLRYRRRGDGEALARVFDALAPKLLLLASHVVRDRAQAEDLVQETFLRAMASAESYDASRGLFPWLVGILHNEARMARRSAKRSPDPSRVQSWEDLWGRFDALKRGPEVQMNREDSLLSWPLPR